MPEATADLALLVAAAEAAGEAALRHWGKGARTWEKPDGQGPVTEADLEADAILRDRLTAARPDYGWMSEETPDDPARLAAARVFVVDPIDGTRAFVAGERTWSVSAAVAEAGRVIAGAVFLPVSGRLYTAAFGAGARRDGSPIAASAQLELAGATVLASRPALAPDHWRAGPPALDRHFRPSIAYRLALVADGQFDSMLSLRPTWEWDVAAGSLIATEAGAIVTDRHGAALRFNTGARQTAGTVAAAPGLHAALVACLA